MYKRQVRKSSDYFIEVPVVAECLMPIVVSVPLQLLAYHIAVNKGRDVDPVSYTHLCR